MIFQREDEMATAVMTISDLEDEAGQISVVVEFSGDGFDKDSPAHASIFRAAQHLAGNQVINIE